MTLREKIRANPLMAAAGTFVAIMLVVLFGTSMGRANAAAAVTVQGLNCAQTMKVDGIGFVLDCSAPGGTPSPSNSASPSSTPTASPSASPPSSTSTPTPSASTTSSPTISPTSTGPQNNCQSNPGRCGFPDALSTGYSGITNTVSGDQTFRTAGQTIANTRFTGCVTVAANNVTFRNVDFAARDCFWRVNFNGGFSGLSIIDSTISCGGGNGTGVGSSGISLLRVEITGCENGLNVSGSTTVVDSWIHDMTTANGAHTDGAQFNQGASDILFQHNTIVMGQPGPTSAVIMWDEGGAQNARVTIANNLLSGGTYTLYCGREGTVNNVRITGNRFGTFEYGYANACNSGEVWSGNVRDSNGQTLSAQ